MSTRITLVLMSTMLLSCALSAQQPRTNERLRRIAADISAARVASDIHALAGFGTRSSLSDATAEAHRGVGAAREWIARQMRSYAPAASGRLDVSLESFDVPAGNRIPRPVTMTDVIATLQGTDTKDRRVLVVGGHYDSRASDVLDAQSDAPGANDDASGVAVVLECLRVLSHYSFPATIKFVAFEGEEQGLIGSAHLAQSLATAKTRVIAMLNNDIVGGDRTPGRANRGRARIFSEGLPENATEHAARLLENRGELDDSVSREFARYAEQLQRVYVPRVSIELEYRRDRYMRGGDHLSFNHEGFAAVRFTDYFENFEHQHQNVRVENGIQYGDLPRFTTPSYTADIARINAITLAALASAPAAPGDVHFLPKLDRGTDLSWSPAEDAAAYRVLWRPTAQPQWEGSQVTTATRIHLPQSADNYIIAVASRSPQAYESLPVVAGVQR